jgi:hypothetical protein
MIWYRATALLVALLVAGCGTGSAAHTVRTHGTLVQVGGPAPGAPVGIAGAQLTFQGNGASAAVRTDGHGRFTVDVAAGTYTVAVRSHGAAPVTVPHIVHIPHTGSLRLVVNIR